VDDVGVVCAAVCALRSSLVPLVPAVRRAFFGLLPASVQSQDCGGAEEKKRAIVALHAAASAAWRSLPADAALVLDAAGRLLGALLRLCGGDSFGAGTRAPRDRVEARVLAAAQAVVCPLLDVCATLLGSLVPPFVAHVRGLLDDAEFGAAAAEYSRWMTMVVHNPGFGLPDGGLGEAALVALHRCLLLLGGQCAGLEHSRVVWGFAALAGVADALRALWTYAPVPRAGCALSTATGGAVSPLASASGSRSALPAVCSASSSSPHALLVRVLGVLAALGPGARPVPPSVEARVCAWLAERPPCASCVGVLHRADVLEAASLVLSSLRP